ncbi:KOW motif domain-containing protein [Nostoc sp.]|uniref:KOW motif domain-containing protein n=1 Tax=Nostoc sp. TaxID=1180 RepID=UPI002FFBE54B
MCLTDYFNYAFGITQDDDVVSLVIKLKRFTKIMSKDYKQDDRVIVSTGKFKGKRGKVVRSKPIFSQWVCVVKLDEQDTDEEILEKDLEAENILDLCEISTEITNIKKLVNEKADKISDKVVKELPEHLTYLQKALESKEKLESENEYTYISKEMERVFGSKLVQKNLSLEKLKHYWEKFLK